MNSDIELHLKAKPLKGGEGMESEVMFSGSISDIAKLLVASGAACEPLREAVVLAHHILSNKDNGLEIKKIGEADGHEAELQYRSSKMFRREGKVD